MNQYLGSLSSTYFGENKSNSQQGLLIIKRYNPLFLSECYFSIGVHLQKSMNLWFKCSHRILPAVFVSIKLHHPHIREYTIMLLFQIDAKWLCCKGGHKGTSQSNLFCFHIVTLWVYQANSCLSDWWRDGWKIKFLNSFRRM